MSDDLISREALIEDLRSRKYIDIQLREGFESIIDWQPTAYDVDKVIKQLEYKRSEYENRINIRNGACYYDETERIRTLSDRLHGFKQALEIVKEGETDEID